MAKYSPNNITNLSQDWNRDETNGLPYSGRAVQSFIKNYLGAISQAMYFNPTNMTLYFFASEEDKQEFVDDDTKTNLVLYSTAITFSSDLYRVFLVNNNNTTIINVATNQEELVLSLGFEVQTRNISDSIWTGTNSGVVVSAYIDVGALGEFVKIQDNTVYTAGETYTIDVRNVIASGSNRVKINFVDEDDASVSTSITYTINMTDMFIEPLNNSWYLPIIEGGDVSNYKLGGYRIVGALNKTLHMDIYNGEIKVLEFEYPLGTASYDQVPFNYVQNMGLDLSSLSTGVYLVSAYITSGTGASMLVSSPVNYNIMYVASGDMTSARLVCINEVAKSIYNYTTSKMFEYSIYNKGAATGSPTVEVTQIIGTSPTVIIPETVLENVPTATRQPYNIDLEWLTEETLNLIVRADMSYGNDQTVDVMVDNSSTFPPTPGFDFYINCATRNNADQNYLKIVNAKNKAEFTPQWTNMTWVDGIDGWITDDIQRKGLYVRAGSKLELPYSEYQVINGDGITLELCYRVSNVSDYTEPVITIADNLESDPWRGIKISPTNILVHSGSDSTSANDIYRGCNLMDEEVVHFVLTIYPNFKGNDNKNLVTGYINGCKNFQFDYATGSGWATEGDFIVGAEKSDVSLYFLRKYNSVLSDANIQVNYINSLKDVAARKDLSVLLSSVMDANNTNIDYESVKNHEMNFFIIEMLNGAKVPSRANNWGTDDKGRCNLEMHYGKNPEWDWKIFNVEVGGQGTTSMNYYRWNLRWRIDKTNSDKKVPVAYISSRSSRAGSYEYTWEESKQSKVVVFDGEGNHPAVKRITAKINSASSMQSHKMGATWAFTELHDAIGLSNPAQDYAKTIGKPVPSVAVYQHPAYGFAKVGNNYEFIGIFTIGPDKGDKPTFGYDIVDEDNNVDIPSELITMEGTDHARKLVMFNSPWNSDVQYLASNESINIVLGTNSYDKGWEVGNCNDLSTDKSADQSAIQDILESEFKPAYELAFYNSTMLVPIALGTYGETASATISYINDNIAAFTGSLGPDERTTMEFYHIWVEDDYDVYYYDLKQNKYISTGVNLVTDHGTPEGETLEEENEWFKSKRRDRFMASAENYWNIHDACYNYVFMMIFGSMDNFGKNSYPVKMGSLNNGGRWEWRQDDLDSLGGIGNLGADTMPTWMEFQDSNNGAPYFGGSQSVFWNLIHECYMDDYVSTDSGVSADGIVSTGKAVLQAMASIAGTGGGTLAGLMSYMKSRFWDKAQNYFPQSAYNADAAFKYETGWLDNNYSGVSLIQSLGNHYSAEYHWFYQRFIYMMSFFHVGPFGDYADSSLGRINFRPYNWLNPTVTPHSPLYPGFAVGTTMQPTGRTWAGGEHEFSGSYGNGETEVSIMASNMLSYLGDWKDLNLAPGYMQTVTIQGSKLVDFKIGDEDATRTEGGEEVPNVTTNIPGIAFSGTNCLERIDARNATSLSGVVDLSPCKRLREAYFDGTSVTQLRFANGQPIEKLSLPDAISNISMKNMRNLTLANLRMPDDLSGIELLQMENCGVDAIALLYDIYNTENSSLRNISVTIDGIKSIDNSDLAVISGLASGHDKDGNEVTYTGVTADGAPAPTAVPSIIGSIQLDTPFYMSLFEAMGLDPESAEDYGTEGLKSNMIPQLGSLQLIYNPDTVYIEFADPTVRDACVEQWGDGEGLMYSVAATVTSMPNYFLSYNSDITSFDEFEYFGVTSAPSRMFQDDTSLEHFSLPPTMTSINSYFCYGCTSLQWFTINSAIDMSSNASQFTNCSQLSRINMPDISCWLNSKFSGDHYPAVASSGIRLYVNGVEVTSVTVPSTLTQIGFSAFRKCIGLTSITIPSSITTIKKGAFTGCSGLTQITVPSSVVSIEDAVFNGCKSLTELTIPDSVLTIGSYEFANNDSLVSITLSSNLNSIPRDAFDKCSSLVRIYNLDGVSIAGPFTFRNCTSLSEIHASSVNSYLSNIYDEAGDRLSSPFSASTAETRGLYVNNVLQTSITIPSSITSVSRYLFYRNNTITSLIIESGVTTIGEYAFGNCTNLAGTLTIPSSVTSIGSNAFQNCSSLTGTLVKPSSLTSIGSAVFQGCTGLTNIYWYGDLGNRKILYDNGFSVGNGTGMLYISGDLEHNTGYWQFNFRTIIVGGDVTPLTGVNYLFSSGYTREGRIYGDINAGSLASIRIFNSSALEFVELHGEVISSNEFKLIYSCKSGLIIHLAKNGVACGPDKVIVNNYMGNLYKIYVGDGTDDAAVLAAYQADAGWQANTTMLNKLAKWSDYSGDYATPPTLPVE